MSLLCFNVLWIVVCVTVAVSHLLLKKGRREIRLHPHGTDGDYLLKMPSDVSPHVALVVRSILIDVGALDATEVWPETRLSDIVE